MTNLTTAFFARTLGVTLSDRRGDARKERDAAINHSLIEDDMFSIKGYQDIEEWLGDRKINLLCEKIHGGFGEKFTDVSPVVLRMIFNRWYSLLDDKAILLAELPSLQNKDTINDVKRFIDKLNTVPGLKAKMIERRAGGCLIGLEKNNEAPDRIDDVEF